VYSFREGGSAKGNERICRHSSECSDVDVQYAGDASVQLSLPRCPLVPVSSLKNETVQYQSVISHRLHRHGKPQVRINAMELPHAELEASRDQWLGRKTVLVDCGAIPWACSSHALVSASTSLSLLLTQDQ
jgi:hypothetical protein